MVWCIIKNGGDSYGKPTKKYNIHPTEKKLKTLKPVICKKQTSKRIRSRCQIILNLDEAHRKILTHEQSARLKGADFHDTDTISYEQPLDSLPTPMKKNNFSESETVFFPASYLWSSLPGWLPFHFSWISTHHRHTS